MQKIKINKATRIQGASAPEGATANVDDRDAHLLVKMGKAESLEKDGLKPVSDSEAFQKPEITAPKAPEKK